MPESELVSVIVPVARDCSVFRECLEAIVESDYPALEILVIDDSRDGLGIGDFPGAVRVIRAYGGRGPARARNIGAGASRGDIFVFIDSDVVIKKNTLSSLMSTMKIKNSDGVVAILSPVTRWKNFYSEYKNIFLRYSFERLKERLPSFYTCCAMLRKKAFLSAGGFDEKYLVPAIEDTDIGHRFARAGTRIVADVNGEVEHVKRYTMSELVQLDFSRASCLVRLFLRRRCYLPGSGSTSVPVGFIASGLFAIGMLASIILFLLHSSSLFATLFIAFYAAVIVLNVGFIMAIREYCGAMRALQSILFMPVDLIVSVAGSFWGAISFICGRRY